MSLPHSPTRTTLNNTLNPFSRISTHISTLTTATIAAIGRARAVYAAEEAHFAMVAAMESGAGCGKRVAGKSSASASAGARTSYVAIKQETHTEDSDDDVNREHLEEPQAPPPVDANTRVSPSPPICPHLDHFATISPFFFTSTASCLLWMQLTPMPALWGRTDGIVPKTNN